MLRRLVSQTSQYSTSAMYKVDYGSYLSEIARARRPSPLRELYPLLKIPGMISLGGGMPHPSTFPVSGLQFSLKGVSAPIKLTAAEIDTAFQYTLTQGLPELTAQLKTLLHHTHHSPQQSEVIVTNGSQEALAYAFEMLLNPFGRSSLLIEAATYAGSLEMLEPLGVNLVSVDIDSDGMIPQHLADILATWHEKFPSKPKPRVLYTIPTGSNPCGYTQPLTRRRQIYEIAREHQLIILEDDPYYYLQFSRPVPSYYSFDLDGRVLRFDSFSKILSAGFRLGFVTGPAELLANMLHHVGARVCHSSNVTQMIAAKVLANMGLSGFDAHVRETKDFYRKQSEHMLRAAHKHLTGLAEFNTPNSGMFMWIKVKGIEDSFHLINEHAVASKVLLLPGRSFLPRDGKPTAYVRASYSVATPEMMDEALHRLALIIRQATKL